MLEKLVIHGGKRLSGDVQLSGAKNSALPILASTILSDQPHRISNVPQLRDIDTIIQLLRMFGAEVERDGHELVVTCRHIESIEAPYDLVRTMRASVLFLGPLLARAKKARISLPGGCAIGARPINMHLAALRELGCDINLVGGYVEASATRMHGGRIVFEQPTVTGTMNAMLAACFAKGETHIANVACEPEVDDLVQSLLKRGAKIECHEGKDIYVQGVEQLGGLDYSIMSDRIEAGTYLIAAAITQGDVTVRGLASEHLQTVLDKLRHCGFQVDTGSDGDEPWIRLRADSAPKPVDIDTQPFPGFPTDMQAQFMALLTLCSGSCAITENIFENRFMHVSELRRMGANLSVHGKTVMVKGCSQLSGAPVMATDLRASAGLVLAALSAAGKSEVLRIYHLDRGYERMDEKLNKLGADIERVRQ